MTQLTEDQIKIHELKGDIEALTCLISAIVKTMPVAQLEQLPKAFHDQVGLARLNRIDGPRSAMASGFEVRITEVDSTVLSPETYKAN
ncbi:hypothetical protein ACIQUS_25635 [Pseudomonas sp. NPDC090755]|uniref:hypothetical protein n=1 Tax=Pseudomonas sp. NPDC090755 TaxID=3364481 RepID=UPI00383AC68A